MTEAMEHRLANRASRLPAAIEVCRGRMTSEIPALMAALDQMTWAEVMELTPHLAMLGGDAVLPLCALLRSRRKQTASAATEVLAAIGDPRASGPLARMMEEQAGHANAIRARDALTALGQGAVPALVEALSSANWEVRYHAVQALAVIGNPVAMEELAELAEEDRSSKVREAAEEAMQLLTSLGERQCYVTQAGFYNPTVDEAYWPEWRVDVINANQNGVAWRFDEVADPPEGEANMDIACLKTALQVYEGMGEGARLVDTILLSDLVRYEEGMSYAIAAVGDTSSPEAKQALVEYLAVLDARLSQFPVAIGRSTEWLMKLDLEPRFHLQHGQVVRYDGDDSYAPDDTQQDSDDWFGTQFTFTFAKAVLDPAWAYRGQLARLKERGRFTHIPLPSSGQE